MPGGLHLVPCSPFDTLGLMMSPCGQWQTGEPQIRSFGNALCLMDLSPWLVPSPSHLFLLPNRHHPCCFCDSSVINSGL